MRFASLGVIRSSAAHTSGSFRKYGQWPESLRYPIVETNWLYMDGFLPTLNGAVPPKICGFSSPRTQTGAIVKSECLGRKERSPVRMRF